MHKTGLVKLNSLHTTLTCVVAVPCSRKTFPMCCIFMWGLFVKQGKTEMTAKGREREIKWTAPRLANAFLLSKRGQMIKLWTVNFHFT